MHEGVWLTVLGLFGLMTISVLVLPLSRKIKMPYTVLLALLGIIIGLADNWLGISQSDTGIVSEFFSSFDSFELTSGIIFFIFLPVLIFEASLAIDVRKLLSDIRPILFLAVIGLFISTFLLEERFILYQVWALWCVCCLVQFYRYGSCCCCSNFQRPRSTKALSYSSRRGKPFQRCDSNRTFYNSSCHGGRNRPSGFRNGALQFIKVFLGGIVVGFLMARVFSG